MKRTNYSPDMKLGDFLDSEISQMTNPDTGKRRRGAQKKVYEYLTDLKTFICLNNTFNLNE